ncbi:MAG TPA: hypothetical protein H9717_08750 [Candidatus Eisenbergiella merdipullorum]|uniref:MORN repeat-containing protein n=1 Tax=Candidatus Eisenbergiella merdipullorum TaxID=2838553 RepID=A0A9D2I6J3_9FIRM|nr:hypothetical protein [Candidatus Eisenbergiella merdipullorum]
MDGHKFNKKELIPIAALLIFIVIVLVLCAVSAGRDTAAMREDSVMRKGDAMQETEDSALEPEEKSGAGTEDGEPAKKDGTLTEVKETIGFEEDVAAESASSDREEVSVHKIEPALEEENRSEAISGNGVSGNTVTVQKTNVEMLAEMMDYWSRGNVEAVEDLSGLPHYRSMSASLQGPSYFYYYGDRNGEGRPDGTGIAVYGEDQYYYGQWSDGVRSGEGSWLKMYYYNDSDTESDRALISHSYTGSWQNNLPNGEGHEQYGIDIEQASTGSRYWQNVMGDFQDGLYNGEMYIVTEDAGGNLQEWYGNASQGVFETFDGRDQEGRVPICQDAKNPDSHLWIRPLDNLDLGLTEIREQVAARGGS